MTIRSIIAALFVCGSLSVVAQKPACCAGKGGDAKAGVTERTAYLAEHLKLDAEQTKSLKGILEQHSEAEAKAATAMKGSTDAKAAGDQKADVSHGDVTEKRIKGLLKPDQVALYDKLMREEHRGSAGCAKEAGAAKGGACCASKKSAEAAKSASVAPAH